MVKEWVQIIMKMKCLTKYLIKCFCKNVYLVWFIESNDVFAPLHGIYTVYHYNKHATILTKEQQWKKEKYII